MVYKITEKTNANFYLLKTGDHLITNNGPYKKDKIIKVGKLKMDVYLYNLQKDEILLIEPTDCKSINENERK